MSVSILILCGLRSNGFSQTGAILPNRSFNSNVLHEAVEYDIYFPPEYDTSKKYPVIFYLHCFGADHHLSNGFMRQIDTMIGGGRFPLVIIVSPKAKNSWFIDDYAGKYRYATMFTEEFVPFIRQRYHGSGKASQSVVTGFSMGGFGALRFAMLRPDLFGICVSFMAGISTKEQISRDPPGDYSYFHHKLYGENLKPTERANSHFIRNNPLYLADSLDINQLKKCKWFIQSCDNDLHSLGNAALHIAFHRRNIDHEYRVNDGSHNIECVNSSFSEAIAFVRTLLLSSR